MHTKLACGRRESAPIPPNALQACDDQAAGTTIRSTASYSSAWRVAAHPAFRITRFRTALSRKFRQGAPREPLADRFIPSSFRISMTIVPALSAGLRVVRWYHALRALANLRAARITFRLARFRRWNPGACGTAPAGVA